MQPAFTHRSPSKARAAAEELAQLTRKHSNRKAVMEAPSALSTIVSLLSDTTGSDPSCQRYAAAAIQNLAIEPEHCHDLVAAGCMEPLLALLQAPDDSEALLAAAAGALSNLSYEAHCCKRIAASQGSMDRLVGLLSHSSCVVREAAASVLGSLAWEPELCKPIAGEGGQAVLLARLPAARVRWGSATWPLVSTPHVAAVTPAARYQGACCMHLGLPTRS